MRPRDRRALESRRRRRARSGVVLALAAALAAAGCPGTAPRPQSPGQEPAARPAPHAPAPEARERAPEEGGEGTFALEDPFTTVTAAREATSSDRILRGLTYHGLTRMDPAGRVEGELAVKWEALRNGSEWVFHLRPESVFTNGRSVEARHVVASWEKLIVQPDSQNAWLLGAVRGFEAARAGEAAHLDGLVLEDGLTLRVILKWPVRNFPARLAHPALGISAFGEDAEGVGPYQIWGTPKPTLVVVRSNPEYFRGLPHLDEIAFVRGEAASQARMATGELDVAILAPGEKAPAGAAARVFTHAVGRAYLLGLNRASLPFSNSDATSKFLASLDREALRQVAGGDSARIPSSLLDDRETARKAEPGVPDRTAPAPGGLGRLDFLYPEGDRVAAALAEKIAASISRSGGKSIPHPVRAADLPGALSRREFHLFLISSIPASGDSQIQLESMMQWNRTIPASLLSELRELQGEDDPQRLADGIAALEARLRRDGYLVPLVSAPRRLLVGKGTCGLRADPLGMLDWTRVWKSRERSGDCD